MRIADIGICAPNVFVPKSDVTHFRYNHLVSHNRCAPAAKCAAEVSADHAATVALECEALKVRQLNGEPVDLDDLVRLTNSLTRIRIELGKRAKAADDGPDWGL